MEERDILEEYRNPFNIKTIADGKGYTYGTYFNRVPVCGYYIEAKTESLLFNLEIKAKAKFKLEHDAENYVQEVRESYFMVLEKYIENYGVPKTQFEENHLKGYVSRGCINHLKNLAKKNKSNVSYFDNEKGEFIIQQLVAIGNTDRGDQVSLDTLEYDIYNRQESIVECYNDFAEWFNEVKYDILTKKQIEYLDDPESIYYSNKKRIENNIRKRLDDKYCDLSISECKAYNIQKKIDIINKILDKPKCKSMMKNLAEAVEREDWLEELLYQSDIGICIYITDAINGFHYEDYKTIYKITNILVDKLNELEKTKLELSC